MKNLNRKDRYLLRRIAKLVIKANNLYDKLSQETQRDLNVTVGYGLGTANELELNKKNFGMLGYEGY